MYWSNPEDVCEWAGVNRQMVVGIVAGVGGDVKSTVLVVDLRVGYVVKTSLGEASWGWGSGGLALTLN
jgi:hypothetical protein